MSGRQSSAVAKASSRKASGDAPPEGAAKMGRPPITSGEKSGTLTFRLTGLQRSKLDALGGADWLRKQIDAA